MADGAARERRVVADASVLAAAVRRWPMLRRLVVTGVGYFPKAAGYRRHAEPAPRHTVLLYCVRGGGWCRVSGRLHPVRRGDFVVLPRGVPHEVGAGVANPWTVYWVRAEGAALTDYLEALGASLRHPVLRMGEDLQALALLHEMARDLKPGPAPADLFHASHTLGHLLSVLVRRRTSSPREPAETPRKVAEIIDYLSEHLQEPLRVPALAALVNLSADHFASLFKRQTGCTPYAYFQLLRMHRAAEWLAGTAWPVKEIAYRLGYRDPFHFSRQFKRFNGASPSVFRRHNPGFVHAEPGSVHGA